MKNKLVLTLVALSLVAVAATPLASANDHCPPPAEPSTDPVGGVAAGVQSAARSTCRTLDTACTLAGIDGEQCWITIG